jgi:hypothetical protein
MIEFHSIKVSPWDTIAFGMPAYELLEYSEDALQYAIQNAGHYTIKVDPLSDKRILHEYGFYYCDTLIEPFCTEDRLRRHKHFSASISKKFDRNQLIAICHNAFVHGRFYRDFNLSRSSANDRYQNWLMQLVDEQQVFGLYWQGKLAGFIGYHGSSLVLHALSEDCRGKGISKYWWCEVSLELFAKGHKTLTSSISAANIPVLNLYASLGFSFKKPHDVYHRLVH